MIDTHTCSGHMRENKQKIINNIMLVHVYRLCIALGRTIKCFFFFACQMDVSITIDFCFLALVLFSFEYHMSMHKERKKTKYHTGAN
jgi:hypothetical protein